MREELLSIIERNSRIDIKELAARLGVEEIEIANELEALERENVITCRLGKNICRESYCADRSSCYSAERSRF